jgi:aldose 1-epimerase
VFTIKHIQDSKKNLDYLELKNSDASCYAKIDLNFGGSLQELKLKDQTIISNENVTRFQHAFNSSILFPFVNRIEYGSYTFKGENFNLPINETDRSNALHGLVFDKTFELFSQSIEEKEAKVTLVYNETNPIIGFPFKYSIVLEYILKENALELQVEVINTDQVEFPFNLGWHPYFKTNDLYNSELKINSNKKLLVNDKMIPNGEQEIDWNDFLKIKNKTFDDCFVLNSNQIEFKTLEYHLELDFLQNENFLQIYTPDDRKSIAIEPQTAPANSFNSKTGLKILKPNETYFLKWKINLK